MVYTSAAIHRPQQPKRLLEFIYIAILTFLFDYLIYKVKLYSLYLFSKKYVPNVSLNFS